MNDRLSPSRVLLLALVATVVLVALTGWDDAATVVTVLTLPTIVLALYPVIVKKLQRTAPEAATRSVAMTADVVRTSLRRHYQLEYNRRLRGASPITVRWAPAAARYQAQAEIPDIQHHAHDSEPYLAALRSRLNDTRARRLVLLGPSGSGKSFLALSLCLVFAGGAPTGPVPLLCTLGGWDPLGTRFEDWLRRELLAQLQGSAVQEQGDGAATALMSRSDLELLPVVDGLEHLDVKLRVQAVKRIDEWLGETRQIVLTSRTSDYDEFLAQLGAAPPAASLALDLQPLDGDDVLAYLQANASTQAMRGAWSIDTASSPGHDLTEALDAVHTPLLAALTREAALRGSLTPRDLAATLPGSTLQEHLLAVFVDEAVNDMAGTLHVEPRAVDRWMRTWARYADRQGPRALGWWDVAAFIPTRVTAAVVALGAAVLCFGGSVLIYGRVDAPALAVSVSIAAVIASVLAVGVGVGYRRHPSRVKLRWPEKHEVAEGVLGGLGFGVSLGAVATLAPLAWGQPPRWPLLALGTLSGLSLGLCLALASGLDSRADLSGAQPSQTVYKDGRTGALLYAAVSSLAAAAIFGVSFFAAAPTLADVTGLTPIEQAVDAALVGGWATFLVCLGLTRWLQFQVARLILASMHRMPWRLWNYFEEAARTGMLRQVGLRYEMAHETLVPVVLARPRLSPSGWRPRFRR